MSIPQNLQTAAKIWYNRGAEQHAAALAYFTPFALTPLIIFSVTWVGFLLGTDRVVALLLRWGNAVDPELSELLYVSVANFDSLSNYYTLPIIGALFLSLMVVVALNSFTTALHHMWEYESSGWGAFFMRLVRIGAAIVVLQLYLFATILFHDSMAYVLWWTDGLLGPLIDQIISFIASMILIAVLYGVLPVVRPSFRARLAGAFIASFGLLFSRELVALHFATVPVQSLYGAAGLIISLLVWVYVAASVILFGAAYAHAVEKNSQSPATT